MCSVQDRAVIVGNDRRACMRPAAGSLRSVLGRCRQPIAEPATRRSYHAAASTSIRSGPRVVPNRATLGELRRAETCWRTPPRAVRKGAYPAPDDCTQALACDRLLAQLSRASPGSKENKPSAETNGAPMWIAASSDPDIGVV